MLFQVVPKVACSKGCMITLAASYDFFPLWDLECIHILAGQVDVMLHWLHLFDFSPLCVIKCILKLPACVDAKLQSHIGCIYLTFLQSVFLNVKSPA